jgi:RsiW-degrading membrane proteinase PrsW (M82 family)
MLLTAFLAVAVPISFLYVVHWLDLYGSDRPRIVLMCFGWGLVAFALSFIVNRFCIDILGATRTFVATRTAPFVEEVFKAGILIYLARRAKLTYFVDGAIYGFAVGIGFAAIENLRYIQLYPDNSFATVVLRDFSSALAHGTATAMTGIALGGFVHSAHRDRGIPPLLVGLTGAMTLHYLWNNFANYSRLGRILTEWILVGVGLAGVALVAATILWGLRRERFQLLESLGMKVGVSEEEANVVQHLGDLDRLLAPIEKRFGKAKRRNVADFLHLEAQLGLAQDIEEKTTDASLRAELAARVTAIEQQLDRERRNVGVYAMLYVRSIFPMTAWSLWARLGQSLARQRTAPTTDLWHALDGRISNMASDQGLYVRLQSELDARARAAALTMSHVHELPEAMQNYMHWVMKEIHVTAQHAAAGLGHHEAHAHQMLNHLVARGFLHRASKDGEVSFSARVITEEQRAARPHIWQSLTRRSATHS